MLGGGIVVMPPLFYSPIRNSQTPYLLHFYYLHKNNCTIFCFLFAIPKQDTYLYVTLNETTKTQDNEQHSIIRDQRQNNSIVTRY